ncbi:MAG: cyclic nucleotide-binding domain-containing protein [Holophagales bacterium]|nr:cyclic nucleotide-binding domain-containing protein [Holophagales bacterium]
MKVVLKSGGGAASFEDYIMKLPPGATIFSEGDVGTEMFVIQSGSVEIAKRVKDDLKTLAVLEKGDFFGEMSILEDVPRTADAIARTDVELVRINQSTFDEMLRHNGEIAVRMLRKLSRGCGRRRPSWSRRPAPPRPSTSRPTSSSVWGPATRSTASWPTETSRSST